MNPLALIPAGLQVYARIAAMVLLVVAGVLIGWTVQGWRLGTDLASLKAEHAQTITEAYKGALAAQAKAQADHQALAADLAIQSATFHEDLTRRERAIENLRPAVAAGTRIVRVAATCPAAPDHVPEAATGGRMDSGAGAVLAPDAGQAVLDLRAGAERFSTKLAACQAAVIRLTGQPRPAAPP